MYAEVNDYVRRVSVNLLKDTINHPAPLHPLPTAGVFERWHMDSVAEVLPLITTNKCRDEHNAHLKG